MTPNAKNIVHLPEERERVRTPEGFRTELKGSLIDLCRMGAQKDDVHVVIDRTDKRGNKVPVLGITPKGVIEEVLAPRFRTPIRELLKARLTDESLVFNRRALAGYARLTEIVTASDRELANAERQRAAAKHARNRARRERAAPKVNA